jgi:hypothetical protein
MKPIGSPPLQPFITLTTSNYRKFRLISIPWTNASLTDCSQGFNRRESLVLQQLLPVNPAMELTVAWAVPDCFPKKKKISGIWLFLGKNFGLLLGRFRLFFFFRYRFRFWFRYRYRFRFSYVCGHYRDTSGNYQVVYRVICIRFATLESFLFIRHPRRQWYNRNGSVYRWLMFY